MIQTFVSIKSASMNATLMLSATEKNILIIQVFFMITAKKKSCIVQTHNRTQNIFFSLLHMRVTRASASRLAGEKVFFLSSLMMSSNIFLQLICG